MLEDVVHTCAAELGEHVVDWVLCRFLDVRADHRHRGVELDEYMVEWVL